MSHPADHTSPFASSPGRCRPLGATLERGGVNFALFSRHAEHVDLLLYADETGAPSAEIALDPRRHRTGDIWHVLVAGLDARAIYGYRIHGPLTLPGGQRLEAPRTVFDPCATALAGGRRWGAPENHDEGPRGGVRRRGRVMGASTFDWEGDAPLHTPLERTLIYEAHVRGYTRHPSSGVAHPGTFLGLCEKIPYLKSLGVTALELLPVLDFDELDVLQRNPLTGERLLNFWGYSPVSYFAPKASYAAEPERALDEFKHMVKLLHRAGIEVILSVVYNHTCEGGEHGSVVCFRGLENGVYYLIDAKGRYANFSGCGNTVNCNHPVVRDLIIESLVYLATELHVDGFHFDLAAILARGRDGAVLAEPPILEHISEHPALSGLKLIAEPWDAAGLTMLGKFPRQRWLELNGAFRDDVRHFIRGDAHAVASAAKRITGSRDLYPGDERASGSVNYVTCHDGFTLADLVAYSKKRNLANGEQNRDGTFDDFSANHGHEGPTDKPEILGLRQRQMRNFLVVLLISRGVPLLLHGDEFGRSQQGNNNAYCQDNETSWVDWSLLEKNAGLWRFARMMIGLRARRFAGPDGLWTRLVWHGQRLGGPDWSGQSRALALHLPRLGPEPDLYVMFNTDWEHKRFALPAPGNRRWRRIVDTNLPSPDDIVAEEDAVVLAPEDHYVCMPHSSVILIAS